MNFILCLWSLLFILLFWNFIFVIEVVRMLFREYFYKKCKENSHAWDTDVHNTRVAVTLSLVIWISLNDQPWENGNCGQYNSL